jgi:hypothetical protein
VREALRAAGGFLHTVLYIYFYRSDATQKLYKEAKDEVINERGWGGGYLFVTGLNKPPAI